MKKYRIEKKYGEKAVRIYTGNFYVNVPIAIGECEVIGNYLHAKPEFIKMKEETQICKWQSYKRRQVFQKLQFSYEKKKPEPKPVSREDSKKDTQSFLAAMRQRLEDKKVI